MIIGYMCYMYVIVINRSKVYSKGIEPRPEGGSPRVKVLITLTIDRVHGF